MRIVSDKIVEKTNIHILCSKFFFENCAAYEIMRENTVQTDRPHMTTWRRALHAAYLRL